MTDRRKSTPEETAAFMNRILDEAIKPNAETLARIMLDGDVALVFHDVGKGGDAKLSAESQEGARAMGWRGGRTEVHRMNKTRADHFADAIAKVAPTDPAVAWLRNRRQGRIYLSVESATFCINLGEDGDYSFEPGTLDSEWLS